jgi:Cupin domain
MARAKRKIATKTKRRKKVAGKPRVKAKAKAKAKTKTAARPKPRPRHKFVVSHPREDDFEAGLRAYAQYRDLGIADATKGMVRAHVIRFVPPFRAEEVSLRHYHDVDFQMVYVLKGWIKTELEGQGEITMRAGSAWIQPPRIEHTVLDYSDDCEVLEVILPADFDTVTL